MIAELEEDINIVIGSTGFRTSEFNSEEYQEANLEITKEKHLVQ